jgi:hypothetical protein
VIINSENVFGMLDGLAPDGEDLGDMIAWFFDYAVGQDSSDLYRSQVMIRLKAFLEGAPEIAAHWKSCLEKP